MRDELLGPHFSWPRSVRPPAQTIIDETGDLELALQPKLLSRSS